MSIDRRHFISLTAATLTTPLYGVETEDIVARWEAAPGTIFDGTDVNLTAFQWRARPLVIFAQSPLDPSYLEQIALLEAQIDELIDRDVVILTDTDPAANGPLRQALRPRNFMLALIGKDGQVKLRKPFPWDVRELSRSIDKMPMRQRELRSR